MKDSGFRLCSSKDEADITSVLDLSTQTVG